MIDYCPLFEQLKRKGVFHRKTRVFITWEEPWLYDSIFPSLPCIEFLYEFLNFRYPGATYPPLETLGRIYFPSYDEKSCKFFFKSLIKFGVKDISRGLFYKIEMRILFQAHKVFEKDPKEWQNIYKLAKTKRDLKILLGMS